MINTVTGDPDYWNTSTVTITAPKSTGTLTTGILSGANGMTYADWSLTGNSNGTYHVTTDLPYHITGPAEFDGEVTIKGVKISETLARIEERLGILTTNPELEEKWENLKGLGKMYRELEAEILEKQSVWSILKK
jgi:hypothetical protein